MKPKGKRLSDIKTIEGYLKVRRHGEFGEYKAFRVVVSACYREHQRKADELLMLFRSDCLSVDIFSQSLIDSHVEEENAKDILVRFKNNMPEEDFLEIIEEIHGGLLTRDEAISLVYNVDVTKIPFPVYMKYSSRFSSFMKNERKVFEELFEHLLSRGYVDDMVRKGHSRDAIYKMFVQNCMNYDLYPLTGLPDGTGGTPRYRLIFHTEKAEQLRRRVKGIVTNMGHTATSISMLQDKGLPAKLPIPNGVFKKLVKAGTDPVKVLRLPRPKPAPSKYAVVRAKRKKP